MLRKMVFAAAIGLALAGAALAGPNLGLGMGTGELAGNGGLTLGAVHLLWDWDSESALSVRVSSWYLPPLFPREPAALYLGMGGRLALGERLRGILSLSGGTTIEPLRFRSPRISFAGCATIGLEMWLSENWGLYGDFAIVASWPSEAPTKLFFPWTVGFLWAP